jgi:hypothetical protein
MKYNQEDILLDNLSDDKVEAEHFEVIKILGDVRTQSLNYVKRVQLVKWKKKKSDVAELDFRRYSIKEKKYLKGISFTKDEIRELLRILKENDKIIQS